MGDIDFDDIMRRLRDPETAYVTAPAAAEAIESLRAELIAVQWLKSDHDNAMEQLVSAERARDEALRRVTKLEHVATQAAHVLDLNNATAAAYQVRQAISPSPVST